jgi:hypothetical protein
MKSIIKFLKWLFGYGTPKIEETTELVGKEVEQLKNIEESVKEMKVIHEVISEKLDVTLNPKRLTKSEIVTLFFEGEELKTQGLSRKDRQYYARKVFTLKEKRNMKIVFNKKTKSYKYYANGL